MTLVLTLEGTAASATKTPVFRLERGRMTIGRSQDCDWPLPDPERTLSRQHCILEERSGRYFLTDTSSNGVFIDGATRPVGRDNTVEVQSGTRLELGDFFVSLQIDSDFDAFVTDDNAYQASPSRSLDVPNFDDLFNDPKPKTEPTKSNRASGLLDESFIKSKPLREAEHPAQRPVSTKPATPHDHTPIEFEALELGKRQHSEPPSGQATSEAATAPPLDNDPFFSPPPPAKPQSKSEAKPQSAPLQSRREASGDTSLMDVFLEAAGVDKRSIDDPADPELAKRLGETYAIMAGGLASLLRSRAMIKREAGVEQTMIGGMENNPLKYSINDAEAVLGLIRHRGQGYLEPKAAVQEAIEDLEKHEIAVLDGMQEALTALLRRFDPDSLEQELADRSAISSWIAGGRKAQYWDLFKSRYKEIADNARRTFLGELGEDFARAYRNRAGRRR